MPEVKRRNSLDLVVLQGDPLAPLAWACRSCGQVCSNEELADKCCRCFECDAPFPRGPRREWGARWCCDLCREATTARRKAETEASWREQERQYREKRDKRARVHWKDVLGPVSDDGDHYEEDLDSWVEWYLDNLVGNDEIEQFTLQPIATTCEVKPMRFDVENALREALEDGEYHEEARWTKVKELVAFVEEWNKKQTFQTWTQNLDLIDWTGFPWLDQVPPMEDEPSAAGHNALRAEIERQLADQAAKGSPSA